MSDSANPTPGYRLDPVQLRPSREPPQPPPRLTGNYQTDMSAMQEWMKQLHGALLNSGLGDPSYQFAAAEIDPAALPSPTLTTIGRAQATANQAHTRLDSLSSEVEAIAFGHGGVELYRISASELGIRPKGNGRLIVDGKSYPTVAKTMQDTAFPNDTIAFVYAYPKGDSYDYEASTTQHTTHTNGVEIKEGDPTRTLIGAVYRQAGNLRDEEAFRGIANWFNQEPKLARGAIHAGSTPSTTTVGVTTVAYAIVWKNRLFKSAYSGTWYVDTANATVAINALINGGLAGLDGSTEPNATHYATNVWGNGTAFSWFRPSTTQLVSTQGAIRVNVGWVWMYGSVLAEVWL